MAKNEPSRLRSIAKIIGLLWLPGLTRSEVRASELIPSSGSVDSHGMPQNAKVGDFCEPWFRQTAENKSFVTKHARKNNDFCG